MFVEKSGDIGNNEFFFEHIILETYEESLLEDLVAKNKNNNLLISVKKNDTIDFIHVSLLENKNAIETTGIIASNNIGDLGQGVYAVYKSGLEAIIGMENLKDYVSEQYDNENFVIVVTGTYTGEYLECIHGKNHEGYLVLKENVLVENINDIEIVDIDNFFFDY